MKHDPLPDVSKAMTFNITMLSPMALQPKPLTTVAGLPPHAPI